MKYLLIGAFDSCRHVAFNMRLQNWKHVLSPSDCYGWDRANTKVYVVKPFPQGVRDYPAIHTFREQGYKVRYINVDTKPRS